VTVDSRKIEDIKISWNIITLPAMYGSIFSQDLNNFKNMKLLSRYANSSSSNRIIELREDFLFDML